MIEVTCGACGSTLRFAEAEVPPGGKTVTCTQCKARVAIPPRVPMPAIPAPNASGGTGDIINLSDLPAPKRTSPLAGAPSTPPKPTTKPSPLAGAKPPPLTPPVPMPPTKGAIPKPPTQPIPAPKPKGAPPSLQMDAVDLGSVDLPAPVGPTPTSDLLDLPAPKRAVPSPGSDVLDLPAPVGPTPSAGLDLPAPKRPAGKTAAPTGPATGSMRPDDGLLDLPAPKGPTPSGEIDLPAPKRAAATSTGDLLDLPAPKGPSPKAAAPAPTPSPSPSAKIASPSLDFDLPAPVGPTPSADLPAPKGFFDDLPAAKGPSSSTDLPAPKGFFDDLPAAKGPSPSTELPAPKGFFDDLPGAKSAPKGGREDDLFNPPTAKPSVPTPSVPVPTPSVPVPTPSVPVPSGGGTLRPGQKTLDLDDLDLAPPSQPPSQRMAVPSGIAPAAPAPPTTGSMGVSSGPPRATPLELDGGGDDVPALELDEPPPPSGGPGDRFGGLDLPSGPAPSKGLGGPAAGGVVSFKAGNNEAAVISAPAPKDLSALDLDVDEDRKPKPAATRSGQMAAEQRRTSAKAAAKPSKGKLRAILLLAALVLVGAGAGGFLYYQKWQKDQARQEQQEAAVATARRALSGDSPRHWTEAANAADDALAISPKNAEALTIGAIANLAGYLDEGTEEKRRIARGEKLVEEMRVVAASGTLADKAYGLYALIAGDPAGAVKKLGPLADKAPKDPDAQLFAGWAHAAARDWPAAIAAYDRAAADKRRAVPATYAKGLAQLEQGDLAGARASFGQVNELVKSGHIGAQVGIAAAMPPADYARRETELLSILGRKDVAKADPRAVARAWTLAGDDARRAGRLDTARDRYRKALDLQPSWVDAIVGEAEVALAEDRLEVAATGLDKAATLAPDHPGVNLALADLEIRQNKLDEAGARLDKVLGMALPPVDGARAQMLQGRRLEAAGQPAQALEAFEKAQGLIGEGDINPTVAQAMLLGKMAQDADKAGQGDQARAHRERAAKLLGALETRAKSDPGTALTLGRAYLAAGDGPRAETWLQIAHASRKDDVEILFQLAEAYEQQGKHDAAVRQLREAFDLDPTRVDVGLELARTYEAAGRRDDAKAMYAKLLGGGTVTLDMRMRAGLFYARIGDAKAAGEQGAEILAAEPANAAGMFLQAEGFFAEGKYEDALKLYKNAAKTDPQALYHDGVGRAAEQVAIAVGDNKFKDDAVIAYDMAAEADPKMLNPQLGRARLRIERREYAAALEAYKAAQALKPDHPEIPYGVGVAYDELKQEDLAIQWLGAAMRARPNADGWYRLARLYLGKNNARSAEGAYASATRLALDEERAGKPDVKWLTDALWQLGQLQETNGNERAACDSYDRYLARNPIDAVKVRETKLTQQRLRCR